MRKDRKDSWAVITGATSGIGLEFTRQLAKQQMKKTDDTNLKKTDGCVSFGDVLL